MECKFAYFGLLVGPVAMDINASLKASFKVLHLTDHSNVLFDTNSGTIL